MAVISAAVMLCTAYASAGPKGGATPAGAGGGASQGGSAPASGPAAPSLPITSGFRAFYVVADGTEPGFQEAVTRDIAAKLAVDYAVETDAYDVVFVAAPGWTQDTLSAACSQDANAIGGVIVKYVSYLTDANWLLWNAERQHVAPSVLFVSCANKVSTQVTPPIVLKTQQSNAELTIPIAPLTAVVSLFAWKNPNCTGKSVAASCTAFTANNNILLGLTVFGGLSGNLGAYNPGDEFTKVAQLVAPDVEATTRTLCTTAMPYLAREQKFWATTSQNALNRYAFVPSLTGSNGPPAQSDANGPGMPGKTTIDATASGSSVATGAPSTKTTTIATSGAPANVTTISATVNSSVKGGSIVSTTTTTTTTTTAAPPLQTLCKFLLPPP